MALISLYHVEGQNCLIIVAIAWCFRRNRRYDAKVLVWVRDYRLVMHATQTLWSPMLLFSSSGHADRLLHKGTGMLGEAPLFLHVGLQEITSI